MYHRSYDILRFYSDTTVLSYSKYLQILHNFKVELFVWLEAVVIPVGSAVVG